MFSIHSALRLILVLLCFLSGCAATGPKFSPQSNVPPGSGVLYVYRPDVHANQVIAPGILVDKREYATLRNGGYMPFVLPAGEHTVELLLSDKYSESSGVKANVSPDVPVFFRLETRNEYSAGMHRRIFQLVRVSRGTGLGEIAACKFEDPHADRRFSKSFLVDN